MYCGSVLGNLINCVIAHLGTGFMRRKQLFRHGTQVTTGLGRERALHMWTLVQGFPGTAIGEKECLEFPQLMILNPHILSKFLIMWLPCSFSTRTKLLHLSISSICVTQDGPAEWILRRCHAVGSMWEATLPRKSILALPSGAVPPFSPPTSALASNLSL